MARGSALMGHDPPPGEPSGSPAASETGGAPPGEGEPGAALSYVVGLGASAGGLQAIEELLANVQLDQMAFVVVQHLAPDHESLLPQLLARSSRVEVVTSTDGVMMEAGRVYVAPPRALLALRGGRLHHVENEAAADGRLPIDYFFRSLAEARGPTAIGVVLSGTGSDGTFGLRAIKAAGGVTFAQEPTTARFTGMPQSALAGGAADMALPPRGIAEQLARISSRPAPPSSGRRAEPEPGEDERERAAIAELFRLIRSSFGTDLSCYKRATVDRRLERRMALRRVPRLEDYLALVEAEPEELAALHGDMLISVTSFFRDHDPFEALKATVFPALFGDREERRGLRAWVPACATGEEAYSIAIALAEYLGDRLDDVKVQIFGTDVDDPAIQIARRGAYPENIALDVSPARLERFFVQRGTEYQISRTIRDMVVFSHQDVIRDSPFSRMDLVSCRNLLIYLQPEVQKKVLRVLHYALAPGGFLLLGHSETVGDASELFSLVDRKAKIYGRKQAIWMPGLQLGPTRHAADPQKARPAAAQAVPNIQALADRKVLDEYGPPGVVIDENLQVLHFRGRAGAYLDPAPGAPSFNLLRLVRSDLHMEVKHAVEEALAGSQRVSRELETQQEGRIVALRLDVIPLRESDGAAHHFLVLFHRLPSPPAAVPAEPAENGAEDATGAFAPYVRRIRNLERELDAARDYLQDVSQEKQNALEELQSANEELQSTNEELQSTNEELETSREEMQAANEELTTLNEELQIRMDELAQSRDDLHNILAGVDNPTIIVGMDLCIRRFTGAAEQLLDLEGTRSRRIREIDPFLGGAGIEARVQSVIATLAPHEEELVAANGRWYELRITPYRTLEHAIRGAVIVLADIDIRKKAEELTRDVNRYAGRFLSAIDQPLLIADETLRVQWANQTFFAAFELAEEEAVGARLEALGDHLLASPELRAMLEGLLAGAARPRALEIPIPTARGEARVVRVSGSLVPAAGDSTRLLLLSFDLHRAVPSSAGELVRP